MTRISYALGAAIAASALACASGGSANPDSGAPITAWSGSLQPTQARSASAIVTERQKAYGTVDLSPSRQRDTRTRVRIDLSAPSTPGVNALRWSLAQGSCGSGSPSLIPTESFPMIELSNNGKGSVDVEIPVEMPRSGVYHINIFDGRGVQLSNVLTCANLRARR